MDQTMDEADEPVTVDEVPLTPAMRRLLSRQIVIARVLGYPATVVLAALSCAVLWVAVRLVTTEDFNPWLVLVGVLLIATCGVLTWTVGYGAWSQARMARSDLADGRCVRVTGPVRVVHASGLQVLASGQYVLEIDTLSLPIDLYAAYALDGIDHAIVTFTRHSRRVLVIRSMVGDLLFTAAGLIMSPVLSAIAL